MASPTVGVGDGTPAPLLFPLLLEKQVLRPDACGHLVAEHGGSEGASARGLRFASDRALRFSPLAHVASLRPVLDELAGRLASHAAKAFLFEADRLDPWTIVTTLVEAPRVAYGAAMRESSGALACRIGLSIAATCRFPDCGGSSTRVEIGDALVYSGHVLCEEAPVAPGTSILMTVLRRGL